jgi:hypothetical protein
MTRRLALTIAAAALTLAACGSNTTTTTTPTAPTNTVPAAPNISAPATQSPTGGQLVTALTVTLTAGTATVDQSSFSLQYRFQVLNDAGNIAEDSGLVSGTTYTTTKTLSPNASYTWRARAESQGYAGAWSQPSSFKTPASPSPYNRPIGDWQSCANSAKETDLVICVWRAVHPSDTVSDMEVVKRVAWLMRDQGAGLLIKSGGDGTMAWQGYSFSASRICFPNGHIYKVIADAGPGGTNLPVYADNDFVDPTLYVKAIDPSKP